MSGRVKTDGDLWIDGCLVLRVLGVDATESGVLGLYYEAPCEVCDGYGYRGSRRCEWCADSVDEERTSTHETLLAGDERKLVRSWCARQSVAPTSDGNGQIAQSILRAIHEHAENERSVAHAAE